MNWPKKISRWLKGQRCDCGKVADWFYVPTHDAHEFNDYACDNCVPRGCSCNVGDDGAQEADMFGRWAPCCEWWWIGEDW